MQIIDIFSGIGGFSLAGKWMGWRTVQLCEMNEFCQKVLAHYWPDVPIHPDIKTLTAEQIINNGLYDKEETTILVGGVPCQPWSTAGKRLGKEDDRDLWEESIALVGAIKPDFVIFENVYGLVNWSDGLVFEQVQVDLENEGYEVQPVILPACAVNAPHRRDRIWFVGHKKGLNGNTESDGNTKIKEICKGSCSNATGVCNEGTTPDTDKSSKRTDVRGMSGSSEEIRGRKESLVSRPLCSDETSADTDNGGHQTRREEKESFVAHYSGKRLEGAAGQGIQRGSRRSTNESNEGTTPNTNSIRRRHENDRQRQGATVCFADSETNAWQNFPTQPPLHRRDDGLSEKLAIFVVKELYDEISNTSKENRIENLPEMWARVQQKEVWEKIRRLYSLESKEILYQTMQLYSTSSSMQVNLSPFSKEVSSIPLSKLQKHGEFRHTPQGQKLQKQRSEEFGNTLSFLPHEIPLAARAFESSMAKFEAKHRNESIKAYGNAIVPQVVYQIFKAINEL